MFYQLFRVTGTVNDTESDDGLMSETDNPLKIRAILVNLSAYEANTIEGWIGNTRVLEVPDELFDTEEDLGAANFPYSTNKINRLPIDIDIPKGQSFKVKILCGAVASNLRGAYEYEPST